MKKIWLIPILLTSTSLPLVSITSCNITKSKLVAIPRECLIIKENMVAGTKMLGGFLGNYQTAESLKGYNKLTIFSDIDYLANGAFRYDGESDKDAPLVIKQVDYEDDDCKCTTLGNESFVGCANLETVIFPPKFDGNDTDLFHDCPKLKTLDFSNVTVTMKEDLSDLISENIESESGTIIGKKGINEQALNNIKESLELIGGSWKLEWKD